MEDQFSDGGTYKQVIKPPLKDFQIKPNLLLKDWNDLGYLPQKYNKNRLTQTDTSISKAYGLAKVHKENFPFRPVISTVGSPTYMHASTLYELLSYCPDKPKSYIKNSYEFIRKIKSKKIPINRKIISLDVKSLYTNVGKKKGD